MSQDNLYPEVQLHGVDPAKEVFRLDRLTCELSLYEFIRQSWHVIEPGVPFVGGWHLEAICDHLQALFFGYIRNLIINVPPRSTKSVSTAVALPAWAWIHAPYFKFLFATYSGSLTVRDSVACRNLIKSEWYQERWGHKFKLSRDMDTQVKFKNDQNGYRIATSVQGSVIGEGADMLVADDIQNVQDATFSKTIRDRGNNFFRRILATRMNDPKRSRRLLVQQRFHPDDVTGVTISADTKNRWTKLILPLEYEQKYHTVTIQLPKLVIKDPKTGRIGLDIKNLPEDRWEDPRTEEGELLCPGRFGPEELEQISEDLEVWDRLGQFQQRPAPPGGGIFSEAGWQFYTRDQLPEVVEASCWSWDLPVKATKKSSFMVGQLWIYDGVGFWLVKQIRKKAAYREQKRAILQAYRDYPWVDAVVIEDKATGPSVEEDLQDSIPCIHMFEAVKSKEVRAASVSVIQENGHIHLPHQKEAGFVKDFLDEANTFPHSSHKDQVDTFAQAVRWLKTGGRGSSARRRKRARSRKFLVAGI